MAVLRMDSKNLHIDVVVGTHENYRPSKKIKDVVAKANYLKANTEAYLEQNFKTLDGKEILSMLEKDVQKASEWKKYLVEVYNEELKVILKDIEDINKKLCKNYEEIKKEQA